MEFCILLAAPSVVTSIVLLVSSCGYSSQDVPLVSSHLRVDDHLEALPYLRDIKDINLYYGSAYFESLGCSRRLRIFPCEMLAFSGSAYSIYIFFVDYLHISIRWHCVLLLSTKQGLHGEKSNSSNGRWTSGMEI